MLEISGLLTYCAYTCRCFEGPRCVYIRCKKRSFETSVIITPMTL